MQRTSALCCGFALHPSVIISAVPTYFILFIFFLRRLLTCSLSTEHSCSHEVWLSLENKRKGPEVVLGETLKHGAKSFPELQFCFEQLQNRYRCPGPGPEGRF